ncbi:hypothetical protein BDN72DRAFT_839347 [Pluteus cervinus]|uniref:Uncharacterized protein n=1 Tax=Pluteus cervinus TaxID=181527 RepID=A0ACD3AY31_9AGAR|nr:hypothetical protein BDN72DRAFT_839347 [Pluteus cervinus]
MYWHSTRPRFSRSVRGWGLWVLSAFPWAANEISQPKQRRPFVGYGWMKASPSPSFPMSAEKFETAIKEPLVSVGQPDEIKDVQLLATQQERILSVERAWRNVTVCGAMCLVYPIYVIFVLPVSTEPFLQLNFLVWYWIVPAAISIAVSLLLSLFDSRTERGFSTMNSMCSFGLFLLNLVPLVGAVFSLFLLTGAVRVSSLLGLGLFVASWKLFHAHLACWAVHQPHCEEGEGFDMDELNALFQA